MSLSTNLGDQQRWPGAENFYGGADLMRDLSAGKSASEIQAYAAANPSKFRSKETLNMIAGLRDSAPKSGGGGGGSAAKNNDFLNNTDPSLLENNDWDVFDRDDDKKPSSYFLRDEDRVSDDAQDFLKDKVSQFIDQRNTNQVDNSVRTAIGDNNVFENSPVGNNYAVTNTKQGNYALNLNDSRSARAKDKVTEWLKIANGYS